MTTRNTRTLRNAGLAALTAGAIALTVFSTVSLASMGSNTTGYSRTAAQAVGYGTSSSSAHASDSSSGTLTCPRTGCTASSCHATQGGGRPGGFGG